MEEFIRHDYKMEKTDYNGRIDIIQPDTTTLLGMSDKIHTDNKCSSYTDAMTGNWYSTQLSKLYFSVENINALQYGIMQGVYKLSAGEYHVGRQSCDELKIIMRSIFLQNATNLNKNIKEQVRDLNKLVLDYCVKQVYGEAKGYMKYKKDVSTLAVPLANPIYSKTNDKQLVLKKFF